MLDTSIPMQVRSPQFDNPMDVAAKAMTLKQLALQNQQAEGEFADASQRREQRQTLADIYKRNTQADGTVNHTGVISELAGSGAGDQIPGYRKSMLEESKGQADLAYKNSQAEGEQIKIKKQKLDIVGGAISSLLQSPNVTHQDVINAIVSLNQQGLIDAQTGQTMVQGLPSNPAQLRGILMQKGLEVMDASKRMDLLLPKFQKIETGGTILTGAVNPMTAEFTQSGSIQKTPTPAQIMTDSRIRGNISGGGSSGSGAPSPVPPRPLKPLPVGALKLQQEALEGISIAGGIEADLSAIKDQITSGKLQLGPISNVVSGARNAIGVSNDSTRNFATFKATLEKLRNDSLRLNKGTQTEGDSQRAWNELLTNINDKDLVEKRLTEITNINKRATLAHQMNLDVIRNNYGAPGIDTTSRANPAPSIVNGSGRARPPLSAFQK